MDNSKGFKYSLCYPDKEDIFYSTDSIDAATALRLFRALPWKEELKKELEYYSPSIDFVRISDKQSIIFSGIGSNYLEGFQVMFIYPNDPDEIDCFSDANYYLSEEITAQVKTNVASDLLKSFLNGDDQSIVEVLSDYQDNPSGDLFLTDQEVENYAMDNQRDNRSTADRIIESDLFIRIAGLAVASVFSWLTIISLEDGEFNGITIFFGLLAVGYITGVIIYEVKRRKGASGRK